MAYRPNAELLRITGNTISGGLVTYSFALDGVVDGPGGAADFEHVALPGTFENLTSVTFTGLLLNGRDGGVTLDNVEYESVPEPATLALFGLGLIGVAATGSRRRASRGRDVIR